MTPTLPLPRIIVEHMMRDQLRTVYPLMQRAVPTLSLAGWLSYARRFSDSGVSAKAGILLARRSGAAHPSGAVCYQQDNNLEYGSALRAEHFIAMDVLFPEAILSALLAALDGIATSLDCSAIRSIVNGRPGQSVERDLLAGQSIDEALLDELRSAGYRADGVTLLKMVPPVPAGVARQDGSVEGAGHLAGT